MANAFSFPTSSGKIPVRSFVTCNINSLSLHEPGGLSGRKHAAINTVTSLALAHDVVCIQDVRAGTEADSANGRDAQAVSDRYAAELKSSLPRHLIRFNSYDSASGGVLTIIAPELSDHSISHAHIVDNHVLRTTITSPSDPHSHVTFFNCYLSHNPSEWSKQVSALAKTPFPPNSVLLGDLNHAPDALDRSSDYVDRSETARAEYDTFLLRKRLEEVPQLMHTFYRYNSSSNTLVSSRIDHVYTNFDFTTLLKHHPDASIFMGAPNTLCSYRKPPAWGREDWEQLQEEPSLQDRQLIERCPKSDEGARHITDHLPISIRLSDQSAAFTSAFPRFPAAILNHPDFASTFTSLWRASARPSQPWARLRQLKKVIYLTAKRLKNAVRESLSSEKDSELGLAIRILHDAEKCTHAHLCDRYPEAPHLTSLANNGASELLEYINDQLAIKSFDSETARPQSKIAAIASSLPQTRSRITCLFVPAEEECASDAPCVPTFDTRKITDIVHTFWRDKWARKQISDPAPLFRAFGRKLKLAPTPIQLKSFTSAISEAAKRESAPGPDGIPFQVYAKISDFAAPVLLACFQDMQRSGTAPGSFNEGLLYLIPKVPTNCVEDTRPLVVNNTDNRIISTVINESITPAINTVVSRQQTGFRKHLPFSVEDNICFYNEKFYTALAEGRVYDILLIDFKKAFDSIAHEAVFKMLKEVGFDSHYQNAIKALFHNAHCYTTTDPGYTKRINFEAGIKQGCPLSPSLFILVIEVLLDMLQETTQSDVRFYADDAAVGDDDIIPKIPAIQECLKVFGAHTGLFVNEPKTVAVTTGVTSELRSGLDAHGWTQVKLAGSTRYLGIYIGFDTTLEEIVNVPYQKFLSRFHLYMSCKDSYSLPKRVLIWNTWLISVFNFVIKFVTIPEYYLSLIDAACRRFVGSTLVQSLQLSRPYWLCGLKSPLRDLSKANLAALISRAEQPPFMHDNDPYSMNFRSQRQQAVDFVSKQYGVNVKGGTDAAAAYRVIQHSPSSLREYYPYLRERLAAVDVRDKRFDIFMANYKKIPSWLPDYGSFALFRLAHNMFLTDSRFTNSPTLCHLCKREGCPDSSRHIFHDCSVSTSALRTLSDLLLWDRSDVGRVGWLCADKDLHSNTVATMCVLINSVWVARCHAAGGRSGFTAAWIVEDCLSRLHKMHDRFFIANFPRNHVPNRHKISYKRASKTKTANDQVSPPLQRHIDLYISSLTPGTLVTFTDGSSIGNPGPTGAGAVFFNSSHPTSPTHSIHASLGTSTNNAGELFAIGLAIETATNAGYSGAVHVFSDSKFARDSISGAHSAGGINALLLRKVKKRICNYRCAHPNNSIRLHYVAAHQDITQNELADQQAGIGSKRAASLQQDSSLLGSFCDRDDASFLSLAHRRTHPSLLDILPNRQPPPD